jgi:hypothetical protein
MINSKKCVTVQWKRLKWVGETEEEKENVYRVPVTKREGKMKNFMFIGPCVIMIVE